MRCLQCSPQSPWFYTATDPKDGSVYNKIYVSDTWARKIYGQEDLTRPPTRFEACGWAAYNITTGEMGGNNYAQDVWRGSPYNNAQDFLNDPTLWGLGTLMTPNSSAIANFNFTFEIISAEDAAQRKIRFFDSPWAASVNDRMVGGFAFGL